MGGKTSSYEKYRRPSILYNAAAVRIKRFTVVGTSDLAWERLTNSGNISLSAGFNIFKKENLSISVAMGGNYHWWKHTDYFFMISMLQPGIDYHSTRKYFGLKGGLFLESNNFQLGAAGFIHEFSNEILFHSQYKLHLNDIWSLVPATRVQEYKTEYVYDIRDWTFDLQSSVLYKDKISGLLGYRNMDSIYTFIIGGNYRLNDLFSFGYAFNTYKRIFFSDVSENRINAHEILIKVNLRK